MAKKTILAGTLHNLGTVEGDLGEYRQAKRYLTRALALKIEYYGDSDIELVNALINLSNVEDELGEYESAKRYYEKALAIQIMHS